MEKQQNWQLMNSLCLSVMVKVLQKFIILQQSTIRP